MAIEPIKVHNSTVSFNREDIDSKVDHHPSILEQVNPEKVKKSEDTKKEDEDKDKEKDKIQLSREAKIFLEKVQDKNVAETNSRQDKLERAALEFRGLTQVSQRRDLTETETQKLDKLKETFSEIGLSGKDVNKLAEKKLAEFQAEAPDLVQALNDGQITGKQFEKLHRINSLLNKSNGFEDDGVSSAVKTKADELSRRFNNIVESDKDQALSREDIKNLEQLQTELSAIQGFRINVRDTVGPDGVVV